MLSLHVERVNRLIGIHFIKCKVFTILSQNVLKYEDLKNKVTVWIGYIIIANLNLNLLRVPRNIEWAFLFRIAKNMYNQYQYIFSIIYLDSLKL